MTRTLFITTALVSTLLAGTVLAQGKGQGVTKTEIILGSHTDLSGPAAIWGTSVRNGMQMRFDEVNALGGIHGRKIKFIVEDNAYTIPKAVAATDKLIKKDKVLAMVANLGSPMNMATIPTAMKAGVPNLFPFSAAEGMYEPFEKMKFAFAVAYGDQMRGAVNYFTKVRGKKKICSMYQDDDFGQDVVRGADIQLKELGMSQTERTTFKRGDKDFSSQIAKLRQAG
ncbi:MAG: ABC transporter substrate-binding protein, partial [Alphaproteobacteria bacterium]|nr:ABC transporter substrate-binding protein [Alphaproteobacteria bacterium]